MLRGWFSAGSAAARRLAGQPGTPSRFILFLPENLLRLSVGLEDIDELWADLEQALSKA